MLPKLEACATALLAGVARVRIGGRDGGDGVSLRDRAEARDPADLPRAPAGARARRRLHLWDDEGSEYLDLVAGLAVVSLGHGHPAAGAALAEQAAVLGHVSNLYWTEPAVALAERLARSRAQDRAFFCNSGAEANEAAIKLARRRAARAAGRPSTRSSASRAPSTAARWRRSRRAGRPQKREPFEPLPAGFPHVPPNDLEALRAAVGPHTCAVLMEPVQGEGGV